MEKSEIIRVFETAKISAKSKSYNVGIDYRGNVFNIVGFYDGEIKNIETFDELNEVCDFCQSVCGKSQGFELPHQKIKVEFVCYEYI